MFNKKNCRKCGEKINPKHKFCPSCGFQIKNSSEGDWGMLGKNDSVEKTNFQNPGLGGFGGKMFNSMLGSAIKMLEKEMQKTEKENMQKMPRTNFKLMINGKEVKFENKNQQPKKEPIKIEEIPQNQFTQEQLKKFSKLPKEEAKTNLKRIGDKIIYEIEMPEVKSLKDVLIRKLESSIEIKAFGKTKAYTKVIPINMPIVSQNISQGKLILELQEN